ncbi:hypothetical protein PSPO01_14627 [Paraphaeosphaeria sporulosa]
MATSLGGVGELPGRGTLARARRDTGSWSPRAAWHAARREIHAHPGRLVWRPAVCTWEEVRDSAGLLAAAHGSCRTRHLRRSKLGDGAGSPHSTPATSRTGRVDDAPSEHEERDPMTRAHDNNLKLRTDKIKTCTGTPISQVFAEFVQNALEKPISGDRSPNAKEDVTQQSAHLIRSWRPSSSCPCANPDLSLRRSPRPMFPQNGNHLDAPHPATQLSVTPGPMLSLAVPG